jgi:ligand-binding sensor domain-containing protein
VTEAYQDSEGNWWFADSRFKRTGQLSSFDGLYKSGHIPFISQWNEPDNQWTYYLPDESVAIDHTDINSILRIGSTMYFGTMFGLLYLDLYNRDWNLVDVASGLNDEAVWDIIEHEGSIYVATSRGINEISIVNHSIIPDRDNRFKELIHFNIYDMEADSNYLYLASDAGLFQLDLVDGQTKMLSKKDYKKIRIEEDNITGTDGTLWVINAANDPQISKFCTLEVIYCSSFAALITQSVPSVPVILSSSIRIFL